MKKITMEWWGEDPDGRPFRVVGRFKMEDDDLGALVAQIEEEHEVEWS